MNQPDIHQGPRGHIQDKRLAGDTQYDVIIVGAGPAGGAAAYRLGRAGLCSLVLEKAEIPRFKPCGGALSASLLAHFPFSCNPVVESDIKEARYILGNRTVRIPVPRGAVKMVMRDRFDAWLLRHAKAEVRTSAAVRSVIEEDEQVVVETAAGERFSARYLIGADGANSVVAREVGLRIKRRMAAAVVAEIPMTPEAMARFAGTSTIIFGSVRKGYLWIFPKADHVSVGIGTLGQGRSDLKGLLATVMARHGISLDGAKLHGYPVPVYSGHEQISTPRVLLVGDAAGLVDPFTGEGIRLAVESAEIAAESIRIGEPHRYQSWVHEQIGSSHQYGRVLASVFFHFPRASFWLFARNPFATRAMVDLMMEKVGYGQVVRRLILSLPVFLAIEAIAALARGLGQVTAGHRRGQAKAEI